MMPAHDAAAQERVARERREADRRYNDALTALDRAVNATLALDAPRRDDLARLANALIAYAQQITAFVETKDREIAANADGRMDRLDRSLEAVGELRTQIAVLQRATQTLTRAQHPAPIEHQAPSTQHPAPAAHPAPSTQHPAPAAHPAPSTQHPAPAAHPAPSTQHPAPAAHPAPADYKYIAFEDQFRGADDTIAARVRAYVPIFAGAHDVVDLGCGRGELLAALKSAGIRSRGVDTNAGMVAIARERGLDAAHGDALGFLDSLADESIGGLVATQVVEHLEPSYLLGLLDAAARTLRPGSPIVLETINVACWLAFFSSYIRDFTHVRPVHPDTLQFLLRASGFERVEIRYSAPVPEPMKMRTIDLPATILSGSDAASTTMAAIAQTVNVNATILNNLLFTSLDYAAIGYKHDQPPSRDHESHEGTEARGKQ